MATGGIDTASEYRACGTFRWQFRTYATSSGGRLKVARMAGIGPNLTYGADLFDHLVGTHQRPRRQIEAKGSDSFKVDHQRELGRLLNR
jgi:hypothetical protein